MRAVVALIIVFGVLGACREKKIVSEQELKEYIMDPSNGLRKQIKKNDIDIDVVYKPTVLVLSQQLDGINDKEERSKTIKNFDSLSYFILRFSRDGKEVENRYVSNSDKFVRVISYLSSTISKNVYLVNQGDTIPALDVAYTRMFGAASSTAVMTVFNGNFAGRTGKLLFCLDDTELGLGLNEFVFELENLKNAPTLDLN